MSGKKSKKCLDCKITIKVAHYNQKRCKKCAAYRVKYPKSNLTDAQKVLAKKLAGTMYYEKLAKQIGCSRSSLGRYAREEGFSLNHHKYPIDIVVDVCKFYEKHGTIETQRKYPNVNVRAIVERYPHFFKKRCVKWTDKQFIELSKMAGLISLEKQAKYFNRPRAHAGSIRSVWVKRFKLGCGQINGMFENRVRHLVDERKFYYVAGNGSENKRKLMLWIDIEENLKPKMPKFIRRGISVMAEFQRKLHDAKNNKECRLKINKMIKKIESL